VLQTLGVQAVRLLTNNPAKILGLEMHGVEVVERVPLETIPNDVNTPYLRTKAARMGHLLDGLPDPRQLGTAGIPAHRPLVTVHYAQNDRRPHRVAHRRRAVGEWRAVASPRWR